MMLPVQEYPDPASRMEFLERLSAELEAIPGGVVATL
jgi:hypothetical protein